MYIERENYEEENIKNKIKTNGYYKKQELWWLITCEKKEKILLNA